MTLIELNHLQVFTRLLGLFIIYTILAGAVHAFRIRHLQGPALAKFSNWHRIVKTASGRCEEVDRALHRKYGPIVCVGPKHVSFSNPEAIPVIYSMDQKFIKAPFYKTFTPVYRGALLENAFSVRDPVEHQRLRRPVAAKYSMTSIKSFEPAAEECSKIFFSAMEELEGKTIDLGAWLQWYAFDVIGSITFNKRFEFLERRTDVGNMIKALDDLLPIAAVLGQAPALIPYVRAMLRVVGVIATPFGISVPDPLRSFTVFTEECIDEYERNDVQLERPDFLSWFRSEAKRGKPLSEVDILNHLNDNLLAGSDTTAIALRAILYYLMKHPNAYRRLQQEIDEFDKRGELSTYVSYAECLKMPYLQAVMKEAMRLCPSVSMILERVVPKGGATICGQRFEGGTIVGMNPAVVNRDRGVFGSDADEFRPERWIECNEDQARVMDRSFFTFGAGIRICLGKNISIMEMGKLIPQLLRHFDVTWASDQPEWTINTAFFARQRGVRARLHSRRKS